MLLPSREKKGTQELGGKKMMLLTKAALLADCCGNEHSESTQAS